MKYGVIIPITTVLSACAQTQPIVVPERISVPTFIPVSATLTQPVEITLLPGTTYGQALGSLREGLSRCDSQLTAIQGLVPTKPPIKP